MQAAFYGLLQMAASSVLRRKRLRARERRMTRLRTHILAVSTALALGAAAILPAWAQADGVVKPFVVIRFNQPRVYYERQLYDAMAQAVAKKPDLIVDVVSNAPATGNDSLDAKWVETASHNTRAVVASLERMGVPRERMRITGQADPEIKYDETRIYVR